MSMRSLVTAIVAFVALGAAAAHAEPGYATANVNLRTGPDVDFPSVGVIPEGEELYVEGCLRDESWCDVRWGGERGWVYSEFIAFDYHGEMRPLPDLGMAFFSIPIVAFVASDYWGRYYVGRPWWAERNRWFAYTVHPRPGWHAPPPGPRHSGWWRSGYVVPPGLRVPLEHGWHRPARIEHRHERREERRDRREDHGGDWHDHH
jgi:uncharacterized protein YraI